jgi:hypothetical protein
VCVRCPFGGTWAFGRVFAPPPRVRNVFGVFALVLRGVPFLCCVASLPCCVAPFSQRLVVSSFYWRSTFVGYVFGSSRCLVTSFGGFVSGMRLRHGPRVGPMPVDPMPVDPMPVDPMPVDPMPVDPMPVGPMPVDPMPVGPMPVDPMPVGPMPVGPMPVDPMPVGPKAVGPLGTSRQEIVQALAMGAVLASDGGPLVLVGAVSKF